MVTGEATAAALAAAGGWLFVDMSGDGGAFGMHMRPIRSGRALALLASGGEAVDDDYLMPVTAFAEPGPVMLTVAFRADGAMMPATADDFREADPLSEADSFSMVFRRLDEALGFVDWLDAPRSELVA